MRIWSNPSLSGVGGSTASRRSNNILLPAFADAMQQQVGRWEAQIGEGTYTDFSSWRFIQPQYAHKVVEYARATDAEIIASGSGTGAQARVNIMGRIAELARLNLAAVNAGFPPQRLREIELVLFSTARGADEQQRALLLQLTREAFPHLEEESLRRAVEP